MQNIQSSIKTQAQNEHYVYLLFEGHNGKKKYRKKVRKRNSLTSQNIISAIVDFINCFLYQKTSLKIF